MTSKTKGTDASTSKDSKVCDVKVELPCIFNGNGSEDFGQWCRRLEVTVKASSQFQDSHLAQILPIRLGGAAYNFWDSLPDRVKVDYKETKKLMKDVFRKQNFITTFQTYINARPRSPGEPIEVYKAEIVSL